MAMWQCYVPINSQTFQGRSQDGVRIGLVIQRTEADNLRSKIRERCLTFQSGGSVLNTVIVGSHLNGSRQEQDPDENDRSGNQNYVVGWYAPQLHLQFSPEAINHICVIYATWF